MSLLTIKIPSLDKTILAMTVLVVFAMIMPAKSLYGQFAGGSGTANDPYLIANVDHLQAIRNAPNTAHYKLVNNIDASATSAWNNGQGFNPIAWFGGKIDGDGFTVSNLVLNRPGLYQAALITHIGSYGVVEKINFSNTSITGGNRTAVVAGTLAGNINNVIITGNVTGQSHVGGIAGQVDGGGIVSNVQFSGNVNGSNNFIGGLTGLLNSSASILNSAMQGTVSGQVYIGGIAGQMNSNSLIENVIADVSVSSQSDFTGGITGYNNQGTIINSSSEGSVSGVKFVGGLVGRNDGSVLQCNSSSDVFATNDEVGGLIGLNHHGTVYDSYTSGTVAGNNNVGGLIGWNGYDNSIINNCNSSSIVTGQENVGGLIGQIFSGTVEESYSSGEVNGRTNVGGLAGYSRSGTLIRISFSTANVYPISGGGNRNQFGGLVGYANQTTIENCFANGSVDGNNRVGGLIGEISGGSVTNSYSSGFVTPGAGQSGGFIGRTSGNASINNSFWDVETSGFTNSAGGIPKTTSQMLDVSTYQQSNWNLSDIWGIDAELNDGYPFLIPLAGAFMILWTGEINTDWLNSENWNIKAIPGHNDNVRIPNVDNKPLITTNVFIRGLIIQPNSSITIASNGTLEVSGAINNMAGVSGIIVLSDQDGTGSLIHYTNGVQATFQRYIHGEPEAWHILSSPAINQPISPDFTPSGTYGDGTGYDFYTWYEPDTSWVYLLNTNYTPTWNTANGGDHFVQGRGYLVSYQEANPTKAFTGILNNGEIFIGITKSSEQAGEFGSNLIGNPYPSSIDWKSENGWDRSALEASAGGHDLWIWNDLANNYGVYNSSSISDEGTLGVTRYIAPTQGFFVKSAVESGNLGMTDEVRVHNDAGNWLKGSKGYGDALYLVVKSIDGFGYDAVMLEFNQPKSASGSPKKFSFVKKAPSLFIPKNGQNYSLQLLGKSAEYPVIPIAFKAGEKGAYSIEAVYPTGLFDMLELHDKQTGIIHDLKKNNTSYTFQAGTNDKPGRFFLQFVAGVFPDPHQAIPGSIHAYDQQIQIDLRLAEGVFTFELYDLSGRKIRSEVINGGTITNITHRSKGLHIARILGDRGSLSRKIFLY